MLYRYDSLRISPLYLRLGTPYALSRALTLECRNQKATKWTISHRHNNPLHTHTHMHIQADVLHLMFRTKFPLYYDMSNFIVGNKFVIIPKTQALWATNKSTVAMLHYSYWYLSRKSSNELPYALQCSVVATPYSKPNVRRVDSLHFWSHHCD